MYFATVSAGAAAKLAGDDEVLYVDESVSMYGSRSSDVVPMKKLVPQTFWYSARKKRMTVAGQSSAISFKGAQLGC